MAVSFYGGSRLPLASLENSPGRGRLFLQLQQGPEAVALSFYGGSRLPFASLENSPNRPLQLPGATQAAADLSCSSNKAEAVAVSFYGGSRLPLASLENSPNPPLQLLAATQAMADLSCSSIKALRPWQCPFMEVQGCRLPALKTRQTRPCSSQAPIQNLPTLPCERSFYMQLVLDSPMAVISVLFSFSFSRERATAFCDMVFPMACHA